jgi:hypothetical protein
MPKWTENDLKRQFRKAKDFGWIAFFEQAGKDYKFSTQILMAVASRETNMRNIMGDAAVSKINLLSRQTQRRQVRNFSRSPISRMSPRNHRSIVCMQFEARSRDLRRLE